LRKYICFHNPIKMFASTFIKYEISAIKLVGMKLTISRSIWNLSKARFILPALPLSYLFYGLNSFAIIRPTAKSETGSQFKMDQSVLTDNLLLEGAWKERNKSREQADVSFPFYTLTIIGRIWSQLSIHTLLRSFMTK